MRWLGHVVRMENGRIPKDLLYGELKQGNRSKGRPRLRFKDVCKRDLRALEVGLAAWEAVASDRKTWRQAVRGGLSSYEESLAQQQEEKRQRRKDQGQTTRPASDFVCTQCGRDCHSHIDLSSHTQRCMRNTNTVSYTHLTLPTICSV